MDAAIPLEHSEEDFIKACVHRERWAQKMLYEKYYSGMIGVCLRYSSNREEALDILHDGFIKVFNNIKQYKPGTSLYSWMRRIMINTAIDHFRKEKRRRTDDLENAPNQASQEPGAISRLTEQEILSSVQQLSPVYRTVFNLYVIEGFSHREVASVLDISESTSRSNLAKARANLRDMLRDKMNRS